MTKGAAAAIALAAILTGCVTVAEFRVLQREVEELKRGPAQAGARPDARLAELGAQVSELREEVAELRGEVEEARHQAEQARADAARNAAAAGATGSGGPAAVASSSGAAPAALTAELQSYEDGHRLYRAGDYSGAIDRFQGFLDTYPSSDYADNALFWQGECHFKLGELERAIITFDDVVKRYPEGNKVPDALYRQGIALLEIGARTGQESSYRSAARQTFQRLVNEHADSERVVEARRQLEKLGQ